MTKGLTPSDTTLLRLLDLGDTLLTDTGAATLIAAPTLMGLSAPKPRTQSFSETTKSALHQRFGSTLWIGDREFTAI